MSMVIYNERAVFCLIIDQSNLHFTANDFVIFRAFPRMPLYFGTMWE